MNEEECRKQYLREAGLLQMIVEHRGRLREAMQECNIKRSEFRQWCHDSKVFNRALRFCEAVDSMTWGDFLKRCELMMEQENERGTVETERLECWLKGIRRGHIRNKQHREIVERARELRNEGHGAEETWNRIAEEYPEQYQQYLSDILISRT